MEHPTTWRNIWWVSDVDNCRTPWNPNGAPYFDWNFGLVLGYYWVSSNKIEVRFYWGLKQAFPKKKQNNHQLRSSLNLVVLSQEMITIVMKVCNDFRYGQSVQLSSSQSFDLTREFLEKIVGCKSPKGPPGWWEPETHGHGKLLKQMGKHTNHSQVLGSSSN